MTLNLIKLAVGADDLEDLQTWQQGRLAERKRLKQPLELYHVTRMVPKRKEELLDGGSLYWVVKGSIRARQLLADIRPFTDDEGIRRCRLVLDPTLVPTVRQVKRPFQGWRYLEPKDAPADARGGEAGDDLPPEMRAELEELGLL